VLGRWPRVSLAGHDALPRDPHALPLPLRCPQYSRTPLHWAAIEGRVEIVKALLEAGADKEAKDKVGNPLGDLLHWRSGKTGL
jgi:hypothetical protein